MEILAHPSTQRFPTGYLPNFAVHNRLTNATEAVFICTQYFPASLAPDPSIS